MLDENPRQDAVRFWRLYGFCIPGEDYLGKALVAAFNPLASRAKYYNHVSDLVYDLETSDAPEFDKRHVVLDNIDRLPFELIDENCPRSFSLQEFDKMANFERGQHLDQLKQALESDSRCYRAVVSRVKDSIELAVKRVSWNFKTAIPQYYPPVNEIQLLLLLALVNDEQPDVGLAVTKMPSGNYLGYTILKLEWAYQNARLICKPDSDWLDPGSMREDQEEDEESALEQSDVSVEESAPSSDSDREADR
jgi:hypothetical protein